jgi:hypothetical protein
VNDRDGKRIPGPPQLIEQIRAEVYREIIEKLAEVVPEVVYEAAGELLSAEVESSEQE